MNAASLVLLGRNLTDYSWFPALLIAQFAYGEETNKEFGVLTVV